jgi:hypothetical protein
LDSQMFEPHQEFPPRLLQPLGGNIGICGTRLEGQAVPGWPAVGDVVVVSGAGSDISAVLAAGTPVVVVDPDADALGRLVGQAPEGSRLAVFVGDPDDEAVREAAAAMARELYGAQ